jgi:hypothetical protein
MKYKIWEKPVMRPKEGVKYVRLVTDPDDHDIVMRFVIPETGQLAFDGNILFLDTREHNIKLCPHLDESFGLTLTGGKDPVVETGIDLW